jgi:hypothetical protein
MKTLLLSLTCVTGLVASAGAQVFQPHTARNILVGSIAGAIIGDNNDKPLEGAAIGAAAGALWSTVTVPSRQSPSYAPPVPEQPVYREYSYGQTVCAPAPQVVVVAPPRYAPVRRRVAVCPPVIVRQPIVVVSPHRGVVRHPDHRRTVVVYPPAPVRRAPGRVVYVGPGYGWR